MAGGRGLVCNYLLTVALTLMLSYDQTRADDSTIQYNILEELPADTLIGNVAIDARLAERYSSTDLMQLRFSFLEQPDQDLSHFAIDNKTGIIMTKEVPGMKRIDRDRICPQISECAVLLDIAVGPAQYFQVINVRVDILDVNDNKPTFPDSVVYHKISESTLPGTSIGLPTATDPDSDVFSIQGYELASNISAFELKQTVGYDGGTELKLIVKDRLDREKVSRYQLKVIAYDGGDPAKWGSIIVNITITDANDNSPVFESQSYELDIAEDVAVNSTITQVRAFDEDQGLNGQVVYSLTSRTDDQFGSIFALDPATGDVFLKKSLDYEKVQMYHLIIRAQDLGPDSQPSYCTVIVHVLDVNDNAPQITVNTLTSSGIAQISEDSEPNTFVAHISAVDHDAGQSGELTCDLNDDNLFRLEHLYKTQYKIITRDFLDREIQAEYELELTCYDMGEPYKLTKQVIHIAVLDVNDHPPEFSKMYYNANIPENNRIGAFVLRVNATDKDEDKNGEIQYKLSAEVHQYFDIDSKFGIISAKKSFDHEQLRDVSFMVIAEDHGTPALTGTVTVRVDINDANDLIPQFEQMSYSFGVQENMAALTEVGYVTASDGDSPPYDVTEYRIASMEGKDAFSVDSFSGAIKTTRRLDREQKSIFQLSVIALNPGFPGMSSTCSVIIHVGDENDNYPIIDYPDKSNTTVQVSNRIPEGYVVSRVRAHDLDISDNGLITYSITNGNQDKLFRIDKETGSLNTASELKHLVIKSYPLRIEVSDHGSPPRVNVTIINVVVNSSIPYNPPAMVIPHSGDSMEESTSSMVIVIGLSAASAFVLLLLILLLVYIRRQSVQRKRHTYRCRGETQKMLRKIEGKDGADSPKNPHRQIHPHSPTTQAGGEFIYKPSAVILHQKQQNHPQHPKHAYPQHQHPVRRVGDGGTGDAHPQQYDHSGQLNTVMNPRQYNVNQQHSPPLNSENPYWISPPGVSRAPQPPRRQASLDRRRETREPIDPRDPPRDGEARGNGGKRPYPFTYNQTPISEESQDMQIPNLMHHMRSHDQTDSHSDSGSSAEMSNTDSGRGPSELDDVRVSRLSTSDGYPGEPGCRYSVSSNGTDPNGSLIRKSRDRPKSMSPPLPPPPTEEELPDACASSHESTPPGGGRGSNQNNGENGYHDNTKNNSKPGSHGLVDKPNKINVLKKLPPVDPRYANPIYQELVRQNNLAKSQNHNQSNYEAIQMAPLATCDELPHIDSDNDNNQGQTQDQGQNNESFDTSTSSGESGVVDPKELCEKIDELFFNDMVIKHKTLV